MDDLISLIKQYGPWQQKLVFEDDIVSPGNWNPIKQFEVLSGYLPKDLSGVRVLDIGANAGGISFEFARQGAYVVALEPTPHYRKQAEFFLKYKGETNVEVFDTELFDAHKHGVFDIVLCLGLFYHFRHPQLVLDYLSTFVSDTLVVSTQTIEGSDLVMRNRRTYDETPRARDKDLSGWEPTKSLFLRMLETAKFRDIVEVNIPSAVSSKVPVPINDVRESKQSSWIKNIFSPPGNNKAPTPNLIKRTPQRKGFTNSIYCVVKAPEKPVDIESAKRLFM